VLRPGEVVIMVIGGANRDPEVFERPHDFDIARPNAREHLAFAAGIHYCLGAGLARLEGEIAFRALADRLPNLELGGKVQRRPSRSSAGAAPTTEEPVIRRRRTRGTGSGPGAVTARAASP
jgi:cytochrome P450